MQLLDEYAHMLTPSDRLGKVRSSGRTDRMAEAFMIKLVGARTDVTQLHTSLLL